MYRGHIALSLLLCRMLLRIALRVAPFLKVYRLIILKHFIISFCLLNHYITTLCCCQVVFFNDYALQTLSTQAPEFPHISVYAPCAYRNCQLYLGSYNYDCQARHCQYEIRYLYLTEQDLNL